MRLWSIQKREVYDSLMRDGFYQVDPAHVEEGWDDPGEPNWGDFYREPYEWIVEQMKLRIPPTEPMPKYPVWAWYQYNGVDYKRPDLRSIRHHWSIGKAVLFELEIPDERVMLSNFSMYHSILSGFPVHRTEQEYDDFDVKYGTDQRDPIYISEMRKTWQYALTYFTNHPDLDIEWMGDLDNQPIQATFWEIKKEYVVKCQFFSTVYTLEEHRVIQAIANEKNRLRFQAREKREEERNKKKLEREKLDREKSRSKRKLA